MGDPHEQKESSQPLMVQGHALPGGELHTLKQWLTADVLVLVNKGAMVRETIALLRQIADDLEADPTPDELHQPL